MPLEWLIDTIKEWVLSLAYATEAWVEAKLYLRKAEYPDYCMPVHVTGTLNPDVTFTYCRAGTLDGKPYYTRPDDGWFIWWSEQNETWHITEHLGGVMGAFWWRTDPSVFGDYAPVGGSGIATVAAGYKYLLTSFVDRGDPAAYDWAIGDLTIDGAWHDLDLSGIVPAGVKSVLFNLYVRTTAINKSVLLRKKGNLNVINSAGIMPPVANIFYRNDSIVACDSDRKIEYLGSAGVFDSIYIVVRGWWF